MIDIMKQSTLAGILIGLGVIINVQSTIPALGAALFSFGLLTIIELKLPLYTGRVGFFENINSDLLLILAGNFLGITFTMLFYKIVKPEFVDSMRAAGSVKFSAGFLSLLFAAYICGMLIHLAVKMKKQLYTVMAIMIFILVGAEHCIADFAYLCFNFSFINLLKLIFIIIGNSIGALTVEVLTKKEEEPQ